ncbi:MAG: acyl-CoA dehydrogenase family protein [Caulobacter sp.]|nr:acyl-CoA dehydrogenase family protein [Caulobacter sp.]
MTAAAPIDVSPILAQVEAAPGIGRLRALSTAHAQADAATVEAVLREAARFCADHLAPLNAEGDRLGCTIQGGRVQVPPGYGEAWRAYVDAGWPTLDHPEAIGGQALPLFLAASVQQLVDSSCAAFGMLPVLQRSAARLIAAHGSEALKTEWLPALVSGEWAASICISEADAGSDVSRLRTTATPLDGDVWSITGEKMWISFGDHRLTPRIGHCLLARSPRGLSLFLTPDTVPDADGAMRPNNIVVRRVEEKMGLHGSPTCALGFEGARGWLIGDEGRGLQQLFVMITNMRLSAGVQGLGLAAAALDVARAYAAERRQGGPPSAPAVPIQDHADVQRMLLGMTARVETLRGLGLAIAVQADLAADEPDAAARAEASALVQWLLPIFKTIGGEAGFDVASQAIQVLGGAGYTREWPVEQMLRDARIATIYEGTTGMQSIDLLHRRLWRSEGEGLAVFLRMARADMTAAADDVRLPAAACLDRLEAAARDLTARQASPREAEAGATAFLHLAGLAATGWIAARLTTLGDESATWRRLAAAGRYWLSDLPDRAALAHADAVRGAGALELFEQL